MITCKICNQIFKSISRTHLKSHGITPESYRLQYGELISQETRAKQSVSQLTAGEDLELKKFRSELMVKRNQEGLAKKASLARIEAQGRDLDIKEKIYKKALKTRSQTIAQDQNYPERFKQAIRDGISKAKLNADFWLKHGENISKGRKELYKSGLLKSNLRENLTKKLQEDPLLKEQWESLRLDGFHKYVNELSPEERYQKYSGMAFRFWNELFDKRVLEDPQWYKQYRERGIQRFRVRESSGELKIREILRSNGYQAEQSIGRYFPDLVNYEEMVVIQYQGCYYHACLSCYPLDLDTEQKTSVLHDLKVFDFYQRQGYKVIELWECEIEGKSNEEILELVQKKKNFTSLTITGEHFRRQVLETLEGWFDYLRKLGYSFENRLLKFSREKHPDDSFLETQEDLDLDKVDIELQKVETENQKESFENCKKEWSIPLAKSIPGKMEFLVWDRNSKRPIGIIGLAPLLFRIPVIEKYIGWGDQTKGMNAKRIYQAYALGAVNPYRKFRFGRLIVSFLKSAELNNLIEKITGVRPFAIVASSAFGYSPMYSRQTYQGEKLIHRMGETEGKGLIPVPDAILESMKKILVEVGFHTKNKYAVISEFIRLAGLPETWLQHGIKRRFYFCELVRNAKDILADPDEIVRNGVVGTTICLKDLFANWKSQIRKTT